MQIKINSSASVGIKINPAAASGILVNQGTPAADWYDGALVAYQPLGAASYADSKINLANPGTYDAIEGVAPGWASETGWDFNGSQYLRTIPPTVDGTWSVLVRFSDVQIDPLVTQSLFGKYDADGATVGFYIHAVRADDTIRFVNGSSSSELTLAGSVSEGVLGFAGKTAYKDGTGVGTIPAGAGDQGQVSFMYIAALGDSLDGAQQKLIGRIQAIGIWNYTLTPTEVATISAAMAAL